MTEENEQKQSLKEELLEKQIHDITVEFDSLKNLNLEYLKTNERLNEEIKNLKELNEQQVILNDTMLDKNKEIFRGTKRNIFWLISILTLVAILLSFELIDKRINDKVLSKSNEAIEQINDNLETSKKSLTISKNLQLEMQTHSNNYNLMQKQQERELKNAQKELLSILNSFRDNTEKTDKAISEIVNDYNTTLNDFSKSVVQKKEELDSVKIEFIKELTKISQNNKEISDLKNQYLDDINSLEKEKAALIKELKNSLAENKIIKKEIKNVKPVVKKPNADKLLQQAFTYQKKQQYTKAIQSYEKVVKIDPTKDIAYYNLGILHGNKKEYLKAIEAYKISIQLNPQRNLSFTNLFEMQLIVNEDFDTEILNTYLQHHKDMKKSLIKYEMIDIFKDVKNQKNIDEKLHNWKTNYKDVSLGNWSFTVLENWINEEKDNLIKDNLNLVLKTFKAHN